MKRIYTSCIILLMLFGISFQSKAQKVSVTVTWDTAGSLAERAEMGSMDWVSADISATATSQVFTLDETWGSLKLWPADGYYIENATTEGGVTLNPIKGLKPIGFTFTDAKPNGLSINMKEYNGQTIHVNVKKLVRDTPFKINLVNGLTSIVKCEFASGYAPELKQGDNTYYFNPDIDGKLDLRFAGSESPYILTLNGQEASDKSGDLLKYNNFYPYYEVTLSKDAVLKIQMYENSDSELKSYNLTITYGTGMEGCVSNIFNRTTSEMILPSQYADGIITGVKDVLEGTELRINMLNEDFTVTKILVNGVDMSKNIVSSNNGLEQSFIVVMNEDISLTIEGQMTEWGEIPYTGYVSDPEGVVFGLSYSTNPADYTLMPTVGADCGGKVIGDTGLVMPEGSKTITLSVTEKNRGGQFFFMPKRGYYIKDFYCGSPLERGSGSASMLYTYDGNVFYMLVEKLPEAYTADLSVTGEDFFMRITANSTLADVWGNPGVGGYSSEVGERSISFIPEYGTPLVFAFSGDETKTPGVYLDGAEVAGVLNEESNAMEYVIAPYFPQDANDSDTLHSSIVVYNSYTARPQMSGASLKLEDGGQAEFFYSPILHPANAAGQVVISGTEFTVRPKSADMTVLYKGKLAELNENGDFVFNATGNARNNIVTVTTKKESAVSEIEDNAPAIVTVYSIDGKMLLENAPAARLGELEEGLYIVNGKKVRTTK